MSFNQRNYERAEHLIFMDSLKVINLTPQQFKRCCIIVDYYISEKHKFLEGCKELKKL